MPAKSLLLFVAWLLPLSCSEGVKRNDVSSGTGASAGSAGAASSSAGSAGEAGVGGTGAGSGGTGTGGTEAGAAGADASAGGTSQGGDGAGGTSTEPAEDALIVPEGISVAPLAGDNGGLNVIALTLREGPSHRELYAAVKNNGDGPACSPSFSVDIYDKDDVSVGVGLAALLVRRYYRLADDSSTLAACLDPGDETMVAIRDLPSDLVIENVARVVYFSNFWNLDAVPLGDLSVDDVESVSQSSGTAYTGTLVNGLDVAMDAPSVAVFPITAVGRPLGVTYAKGTVEVPAGGSWDFETDALSTAGADYAAFPASGP
jgi:hypothetical protein